MEFKKGDNVEWIVKTDIHSLFVEFDVRKKTTQNS